jgi:hypothetical protein
MAVGNPIYPSPIKHAFINLYLSFFEDVDGEIVFSSLFLRSSFAICSLQGGEKSTGFHRANVEQMRL